MEAPEYLDLDEIDFTDDISVSMATGRGHFSGRFVSTSMDYFLSFKVLNTLRHKYYTLCLADKLAVEGFQDHKVESHLIVSESL